MKPLLLHGGAKIASRKKLIDLKQQFDSSSISVFEQGSSVQDILGAVATVPLLQEERLIILENPPEDFFYDLSLVTGHLLLVLWFDHQLKESSAVLKWIREQKGEILNFPESREKSIFPLLDMLTQGDKKAFFELEQLKLAGFDIQYFITMIFYQLRNLAAAPAKAPQFVKEKLIRQKDRFSQERIKTLYREILEIDFKIKSGLLETKQAEFLIVSKFLD